MSVDKMSVDKMSVDKMSVDKMSVDKMSVDKMMNLAAWLNVVASKRHLEGKSISGPVSLYVND